MAAPRIFLRRVAFSGIFALWTVAVLGAGTYAFGPHAVAFRNTKPTEPVSHPSGQWEVFHIVSAGCGCSSRLIQHLALRGSRSDVREHVVVIGHLNDEQAALREKGFDVIKATADNVRARFGVQGGPWLIACSPAGNAAYSGGYAPRQIASPDDVRDLDIFDRLLRGEDVIPYPAFGCAISAAAKRAVDPLGLLTQ